MRRWFSLLSRHKKAIASSLGLLVLGALFRWEVREVDDAQTGAPLTRYQGVVLPGQPCGVRTGGGKPINFHVKHWLAYGLVRVEANGQTY
jgi:hypothetical protein